MVKKGLNPTTKKGGDAGQGFTLAYVGSGDSNAIYKGDPVKWTGTGADPGITGLQGRPTVAVAAATDTFAGVLMALTKQKESGTPYRAASTAAFLLINDDVRQLYSIAEDMVGSSLALTSMNGVVDITGTGSGNNGTGFSSCLLDSSTFSDTSTGNLRIEGVYGSPDNVVGTDPAFYVVRINEFQTGALGAAGNGI